MKSFLKILTISLLSIVVLFFLIVTRLFSIKIYDTYAQVHHMNLLEKMYEDDEAPLVDESSFLNFDATDETIKLNDIQMLASHNSYKKKGSDLGHLFVGLGDSFDEARAMQYGYQKLTRQLELGIRSFEFDLRLRKTNFMLTHVPLVDNSSVAPRFDLALEELNLYSEHHPDHLPIIILMEIKDDWMILDHALNEIDDEALLKLDTLIKDKLGDKLFQPNNMLQEDETLYETILNTGWPSVASLRGKFIFVLHPGSFTTRYAELDPSLETQSMFIGTYYEQSEVSYASFVVHNDPNMDTIQSMVQRNLIVRTRIDSNLSFDLTRYEQAIASGAQILTSDFTVGRKDLPSTDTIYLNQTYMMIRKEDA